MKQRLVLIGVIFQQNRLLLVKRSAKDGHRAGVWEFPGGELKLGEHIAQGLKREIKEEVGIEITVRHPIWADEFVFDGSDQYLLLYFLCEAQDNPNVRLSEEHSEYKWINPSELKDVRKMSNALKNAVLETTS